MNLFKLHSDLAERLRLKLGWSHYAIYWVSFIKGVGVTCLVLWLISLRIEATMKNSCLSSNRSHRM